MGEKAPYVWFANGFELREVYSGKEAEALYADLEWNFRGACGGDIEFPSWTFRRPHQPAAQPGERET